jgi:N-carbamoylputrescine amidase
MIIGAAQIESVVGDVDANVERHLHWIAKGKEAGLDMLVFPEVSLVSHHGGSHLLTAAIRRDDPRLLALAKAAGDMHVVVGFIEEGQAAQFYNAAAILHRGGLSFIHRKVNLPTYGELDEGKYYAPGRYVETHEIDSNWRAGLLICADMWNPALTHLSFLHGATLMITPVSSGVEAVGPDFDNPGGWALTMRFYSMMYGAPSIMVNRVGVEQSLTFWGGSRIIDPFGRELAVAGSGEELLTATLDYNDLRRARVQLPTVRDSNIGLVHRETSRLLDRLGVPDFIRP